MIREMGFKQYSNVIAEYREDRLDRKKYPGKKAAPDAAPPAGKKGKGKGAAAAAQMDFLPLETISEYKDYMGMNVKMEQVTSSYASKWFRSHVTI